MLRGGLRWGGIVLFIYDERVGAQCFAAAAKTEEESGVLSMWSA